MPPLLLLRTGRGVPDVVGVSDVPVWCGVV